MVLKYRRAFSNVLTHFHAEFKHELEMRNNNGHFTLDQLVEDIHRLNRFVLSDKKIISIMQRLTDSSNLNPIFISISTFTYGMNEIVQ